MKVKYSILFLTLFFFTRAYSQASTSGTTCANAGSDNPFSGGAVYVRTLNPSGNANLNLLVSPCLVGEPAAAVVGTAGAADKKCRDPYLHK